MRMKKTFSWIYVNEIAGKMGISKSEVIWMIEEISGKPYYHWLVEDFFPEDLKVDFYKFLKKRKEGIPLPYLGFTVSFMGLDLLVPEGVFIPRPETEVLVERVFDVFPDRSKHLHFVDVGTGSGAIALAILKQYGNAIGWGIDLSKRALRAASQNARRLGIDRLHLILGDCLNLFKEKQRFDLVISNPPYISEGEYEELPIEVKREPRESLLGGGDGLLYHRRILKDSPKILSKRGVVILEIAPHQSKKIVEIAHSLQYEVETFLDLDNRIRGISAYLRKDAF